VKTDPAKLRAWRERSAKKAMEKKRQKKFAQPWKAKAPIKRTPLKKVSKSMRRKSVIYFERRVEFLREHPVCGACLARGINPAPSAQLHHSRGRIGRLYLDERFWIGVCAPCHAWIHEEAPNEARELGLLASVAEWNTFPKDENKS